MNSQVQPEGIGLYPSEIAAMLWRRRYWIAGSIGLSLVLASLVIWVQNPLYRSSATLLIESPQVSSSIVAPLSQVADERIAKIRQQILSDASLSTLIKGHDLYPADRAELAFPMVIEKMRNSIAIDLVPADERPGSGKTIAFTLSYTYDDPFKARDVADQLTKMFLSEDERFSTERATGTAAFLASRSNELQRQLRDLEDRRRDLEMRYSGALPNSLAATTQSGATLRAEIARIDAETQALVQQNGMLAAQARQLAETPPAGTDLLRRAEERLAQLSAVYADEFPEVQAARAEVELQRKLLEQATPKGRSGVIEAEIVAARERMAALAGQRTQLVRAMGEMEQRAEQAPQAAFEVNRVNREFDELKRQYESLREKQLDAQLTANLQTEGKGERFAIVNQPSLPFESSNKKPSVILLAALIGGAALGAALIVAFELLTGTIHGEKTLARVLNAPTLGVVRRTGQRSMGLRFNRAELLRRIRAPFAAAGEAV